MKSHCLVSSLFTPKVRILRRGRSYVLGRDPKADFPLPAEVISRAHAELVWNADGSFAIKDRGSKNGTRVNGIPVMGSNVLKDGDLIEIGPFSLQYREYQGDMSGLLEQSKGVGDQDATTAISRDALTAGIGSAVAAGFGGNFAGQELLEIVRLVAFGERDGVLTVLSDRASGQIGFEKGAIRRANTGELVGEPAAALLLSIPNGRFEFAAGKFQGERNCRLKTELFAVDVARRLDELAGRPPGSPLPPASPAPPLAKDQVSTDRLMPIRFEDYTQRSTKEGEGPP